jgi:hypothetical protein
MAFLEPCIDKGCKGINICTPMHAVMLSAAPPPRPRCGQTRLRRGLFDMMAFPEAPGQTVADPCRAVSACALRGSWPWIIHPMMLQSKDNYG